MSRKGVPRMLKCRQRASAAQNTAELTITNDDSATLTIEDATPVLETHTGTPQLVFPVTLDNPVDVDVSAQFETQDGTATTADNDYDANTGTLVWKYPTGGPVSSSPNVVDGKLYIGSFDHYVYCLDAADGTLIWRYETGKRIFRTSPTVVDGKVYIGSLDTIFYCLDAATGTQVWNFTNPACQGYAMSSACVVDGRVYVGDDQLRYPRPIPDNFYCLDADTGAFVWSYQLNTGGYPEDSSPAVWSGYVYVGSIYGRIRCLNAETGAHVWSCSLSLTSSQDSKPVVQSISPSSTNPSPLGAMICLPSQ